MISKTIDVTPNKSKMKKLYFEIMGFGDTVNNNYDYMIVVTINI